jgi:hypothetical protein
MPLGTMLTMLGLTALLVAAALSFAVMLGSLIRRSTLSILLAFLLLFIVLPIVSFALSAANTPSWWIITSAANVVVNPSTGLGAVGYTPGWHHCAPIAVSGCDRPRSLRAGMRSGRSGPLHTEGLRPMSSPNIVIEDLAKTYGSAMALDGVRFTLEVQGLSVIQSEG